MSYFKYLFAKSRTEELNKTVENMTNSITRGFLERKVEILEKELGETNQAIQDIIELEKTEDDRVFKKYYWQKWEELPKAVRRYLASRYGLEIVKNTGIARYMGFKMLVKTDTEPFCGQTFDRINEMKKARKLSEENRCKCAE